MMTTANCGHCSGLMVPDPLDGGTVCSSCGGRGRRSER